ncbi:VPS35 endosomal protein-sorting factor-like isoform X2 [Xenia sp. Carnegie-2017]|nr:VPS35 endosomal protein-sorting factor-like isoform X2 [Xenia sp. Carnegie-2017]
MLASVNVIGFYPSKFVLITDVLDTFGRLVYERLLRKSATIVPGTKIIKLLPENFISEDVTDVAKETCRNWFYKIASIRELIPRFYVETSILKCLRFLTTGEYEDAVVRLTKMIRGIGDPLVATYARCYICRVGILVAPEAKSHLRGSLLDFFYTYKQLQTDVVQNTLAKQNISPSEYLQLYTPALDWIVQCIAFKSPEEVLTEILNHCRKDCNSALILNSIVSAFRPSYTSARALEFVKIISECEDAGFPKYQLYRSLGLNVILEKPPEAHRLQLLNEVWKVVTKLNSPEEYISCAEIWVEYPIKYFGKREIDTLLGDILKHLNVDRLFEKYYQQLLSILSKVLAGLHDFSVLFSMNNFHSFLDMFQKESVKADACRLIMESFCRYQKETTDDPVIVNGLMFVSKILHDSVSSLSTTDEKRAIGQLVTGFVRKIDYGRDFEKQLNFYVEARAMFCNLDAVLVCLVQCVNLLSMKTRKIMKGKHSRKTAAFIRACVAYSFITIPSIEEIFNRLTLYLESGKVAFANQALSQGDAFLKAAISLIVEVPKTIEIDNKTKMSEPYLVSYVNNFLSFLLVVPDHPDQGVLYLVRGLLNVVEDFVWDSQNDSKIKIYLNVICLLSAMTQDLYLYHMENVVSNDDLYGSDKKFIAEVHKIISTVIDDILQHLKTLVNPEMKKRQGQLAMEFLIG